MGKKIAVFAPHPDDETLGCGGTIARRISEGCEVVVAVMTDGRHAFSQLFGSTSDPSPEELKEIRMGEVTSALRILGVQNEDIVFFGFEDGTLGKHEKEVEDKVVALLKDFVPTEVYFPYRKDTNLDHQVASKLVQDAFVRFSFMAFRYQYSIARKFSRLSPFVSRLLNPIRRNLVYVDISQFLQKKQAAVSEFKSQITVISSKQQRPVMQDFGRFLKGKEAFYVR